METARELSENLAALLRREHGALADFLVALADFDRRGAWRELGHASLFYYLHRELKLSKAAAQYRKVAAELIQQIPGIVEPLRDGRLCMTTVVEVARVATVENWEAVLPRFYGLFRREAMEVVAALAPHPAPPVRTVITSAPVAVVPASSPAALPQFDGVPLVVSSPGEPAATATPTATITSTVAVAPSRPAELVPLTATLDRLHVTVSKEFARKLRDAADANPELSTEALLEAGLDLLLAKADRRKGSVARPQRSPRPTSSDDHVPAHVRRAVWARDGGKCQWRLPNGELCGCARRLQLDHVIPRALGGKSTLDNLRLLCRAHNLEAARQVLGVRVMDRYARPRTSTRARHAPGFLRVTPAAAAPPAASTNSRPLPRRGTMRP